MRLVKTVLLVLGLAWGCVCANSQGYVTNDTGSSTSFNITWWWGGGDEDFSEWSGIVAAGESAFWSASPAFGGDVISTTFSFENDGQGYQVDVTGGLGNGGLLTSRLIYYNNETFPNYQSLEADAGVPVPEPAAGFFFLMGGLMLLWSNCLKSGKCLGNTMSVPSPSL